MNSVFTQDLKQARKKDTKAFWMVSIPIGFLSWMLLGLFFRNDLQHAAPFSIFIHWLLFMFVNLNALSSLETLLNLKRGGYSLNSLETEEKVPYLGLLYQIGAPALYSFSGMMMSFGYELEHLLLRWILVIGSLIVVFGLHAFYLQHRTSLKGVATQRTTEIIKEKETEVRPQAFSYLATSSHYDLSQRIVETRSRLQKASHRIQEMEIQRVHDIEYGISLFNKGLHSFEALPKEEQVDFRTYMDWVLDYIHEQLKEVEKSQNKTHRYELIKMKEQLKARG